MPSLMEQAVVDADKLREAAMRNAENSILEKYSKNIKGALKTILEQAPPMPGMEEEMPMPPEAGMMPPGPMPGMPGMAPPGPDLAAEAGIPLAATGGEKLCPCPDVEATVPITINLDDLIGVADMIKDENAPVAPEMLEAPPADPMMMAQPPMDPMMMDQQQMMMESEMIDINDLLREVADYETIRGALSPGGPHAPVPPMAPVPPPSAFRPAAGAAARGAAARGALSGAGRAALSRLGPYGALAAGGLMAYDALRGTPSAPDSIPTAPPGDWPEGLEKPDPTQYYGGRGYLSPQKAATAADVKEIGLGDYAMRTLKGAGAGAATAAALGQFGPQVGLPEEIITVPMAALAGGATGFLSALYDDMYADKNAFDQANEDFEASMKNFKYGDKDVTGKPVPPPTKTAGPEKDPETGEYGSPSGTGSRDPLKAPGFGTGEGEIPVEAYFVDGRYQSALGFTPGTSSWLREKNSVQMEMARQRWVAGDRSALGTVRRLEAELRSIPQYTKVDNAIAKQARKGQRGQQRIMTRKTRQQARPELASQRRELRNMPRQEFAGVGGGYSAFPQAPLQEGNDNMIDITEEQLNSIIEELVVDMSPDTVRSGWAGLPESEKDYAEEIELARRSSTEEKEKQEAIQDAVKDLSEKNDRLTKYSTELSQVAQQLKEKLEDVSLQNAKLFYINRTLSDASLNGRQKNKIAESIQSAVSVEEAKVIYETLQSAVPNSPSGKRGKKTLSEAISRPSAILPRRKSGASDREMVFRDRMKILAGIK